MFFELIQSLKDGEIATTGKLWEELDREAISELKLPSKTIALEGEEPEVIKDLPKDSGWKDALEGYQGGITLFGQSQFPKAFKSVSGSYHVKLSPKYIYHSRGSIKVFQHKEQDDLIRVAGKLFAVFLGFIRGAEQLLVQRHKRKLLL